MHNDPPARALATDPDRVVSIASSGMVDHQADVPLTHAQEPTRRGSASVSTNHTLTDRCGTTLGGVQSSDESVGLFGLEDQRWRESDRVGRHRIDDKAGLEQSGVNVFSDRFTQSDP